MKKNNKNINIQKRSDEVVSSAFGRGKKTTVKQNLFKRISLQAVQMLKFSHSQNSHSNALHCSARLKETLWFHLCYNHILMSAAISTQQQQPKKEYLFIEFSCFFSFTLMKCNSIDMLCTISLGRKRK